MKLKKRQASPIKNLILVRALDNVPLLFLWWWGSKIRFYNGIKFLSLGCVFLACSLHQLLIDLTLYWIW